VLPNPSRIPQAATITKRKYSYVVRARGTNSITGEPMTQHVTITSDDLISKAEALDHAGEAIAGNPQQYNLSFEEAVVTEIKINPLFA